MVMAKLNDTEIKLVKLICNELTAKEIATRMGLGVRTIEGYRLDILRKVKAKNVVGIALWAVRNGVVKL